MSSLKDILTGRLRVPPTTGTLAQGLTPPRSSVLDHVTKRNPSYSETLSYQEVYDIFGIKQGDSFALVQRLLRDRWPSVTIVKKQAKPPRRQGPTVAEQILLKEIDGLKEGCKTEILQLHAGGFAADRIVAETKINCKQVRAIIDGCEMTDEAAANVHLTLRGEIKPGHSKDTALKACRSLKTRISRARKAARSIS